MTTSPDAGQQRTGYAPVNSLEMYYEIHGSGQPLVLLHGAFSAIGTSFEKVLPGLAKTRQVIAFEMQVTGGQQISIDRSPSNIWQMTPLPVFGTWASSKPTSSATAPVPPLPSELPSGTSG